MKNADMPAMPQPIAMNESECLSVDEHQGDRSLSGLTKREMFAMHAMQNILSRYNPYEYGDLDSFNYEETAEHAVGLADALLKELSK